MENVKIFFKKPLFYISLFLLTQLSFAGTSVRPYVKIAVIETGDYQGIYDRLHVLGYTSTTSISKYSGYDTLMEYDMIYLPVGWASGNMGDPDTILSNSEDYIKYVEDGGGLLVEQPNPYQYNFGQIKVTLLPVPVTFTSGYNQNDFPATIADTTHFLTHGLSRYDMPFPADQVIDLDTTSYHVLSYGSYTQTPSLFVMDYGNGKTLVHTAHSSAGYKVVDTMLVRIISWLTPNVNALEKENEVYPQQLTLEQNYPNPFNSQTTIRYTLEKNSSVEINIYDITGRQIYSYVLGNKSAGQYRFNFEAHNLSSGIYFYQLKTADAATIRKMMYVK